MSESEVVAAWVARGRSAWPNIPDPDGDFERYLKERVTTDGTALDLHAEDLCLARACARADARAIVEFERRYVSEIPSFLTRTNASPVLVDEIRQRVRDHLFVQNKIAAYAGRGPLSSWLRVVTLRIFATATRRGSKEVAFDEAVPGPVLDPELGFIQQRYGAVFQEALREAFAGLSSDERTLLRLHYVDGLNIDSIGKIFKVSRATVGRRLVSVRARIVEETHRALGGRLRASPEELESILRVVRSKLGISLSMVLGPRDDEAVAS